MALIKIKAATVTGEGCCSLSPEQEFSLASWTGIGAIHRFFFLRFSVVLS